LPNSKNKIVEPVKIGGKYDPSTSFKNDSADKKRLNIAKIQY
jgi:hypothetical protein